MRCVTLLCGLFMAWKSIMAVTGTFSKPGFHFAFESFMNLFINLSNVFSARKTKRVFPELTMPSPCHDYDIKCKFTYRCVNCGYESVDRFLFFEWQSRFWEKGHTFTTYILFFRIHRHSKSLDTDRKVCGHCRSPFELLRNSTSSKGKATSSATPHTPRTPNKFALFVKENYGSVRSSGSLSHADVMRKLSKDFAAQNIRSSASSN